MSMLSMVVVGATLMVAKNDKGERVGERKGPLNGVMWRVGGRRDARAAAGGGRGTRGGKKPADCQAVENRDCPRGQPDAAGGAVRFLAKFNNDTALGVGTCQCTPPQVCCKGRRGEVSIKIVAWLAV